MPWFRQKSVVGVSSQLWQMQWWAVGEMVCLLWCVYYGVYMGLCKARRRHNPGKADVRALCLSPVPRRMEWDTGGMPLSLSQLCCSQGLARVNKLQSCPSSSLHPLAPFTFVHQKPSDIKILQCPGRYAGKCRVHGMQDKSDLKRAAVAVTLPRAAKAGDEELWLAPAILIHWWI